MKLKRWALKAEPPAEQPRRAQGWVWPDTFFFTRRGAEQAVYFYEKVLNLPIRLRVVRRNKL